MRNLSLTMAGAPTALAYVVLDKLRVQEPAMMGEFAQWLYQLYFEGKTEAKNFFAKRFVECIKRKTAGSPLFASEVEEAVKTLDSPYKFQLEPEALYALKVLRNSFDDIGLKLTGVREECLCENLTAIKQTLPGLLRKNSLTEPLTQLLDELETHCGLKNDIGHRIVIHALGHLLRTIVETLVTNAT